MRKLLGVVFREGVTIPSTDVQETRFYASDGWDIRQLPDGSLVLEKDQRAFSVHGFAYSCVGVPLEVEEVPAKESNHAAEKGLESEGHLFEHRGGDPVGQTAEAGHRNRGKRGAQKP